MSNITDLKDRINTKTINLVLLTIPTFGLYLLLWLFRNVRVIDEITKTRTATDAFIIWIAICYVIHCVFLISDETEIIIIRLFFSIVGSVLWIVWAFRARKALQKYALNEHKVDLQMNPFYTFFFNLYYINYCINDLPEDYEKQQILRNQNEAEKS